MDGYRRCSFFACPVVIPVVLKLSPTVADALTWLLTSFFRLYDAYVRLWIKDGGAVFIVQLGLCAVVGSLYVVLLNAHLKSIHKRERREIPIDTFDLRTLTGTFNEYAEMDILLPMCYQQRLLQWSEIERIRNESSRSMQVVNFIERVVKKGHKGLFKLLKCLEETAENTGHEDIASEIREGIGQGFLTTIQEFQEVISDQREEIGRLHAENHILSKRLEEKNKELERVCKNSKKKDEMIETLKQ